MIDASTYDKKAAEIRQQQEGKGGELRMSFRSPFSQLGLSNRATHTDNGQLGGQRRCF